MWILAAVLVVLVVLLTAGVMPVLKVVGWFLVGLISLIIVAQPFLKYSISRSSVKDAKMKAHLKRMNHQDSTEADNQYQSAKASHEATYPILTSIRGFLGKDI